MSSNKLSGTITILVDNSNPLKPVYKSFYPITDIALVEGAEELIEEKINTRVNDIPIASLTDFGLAKTGDNITNDAGILSITKDNIISALGLVPIDKETLVDNARIAEKLKKTNTIDGINFDGTDKVSRFGRCSTTSNISTKTVTCPNFTLTEGAIIYVLFENANTAAYPMLSVNSTGARPIQYKSVTVTPETLQANIIYQFVYDGESYQLIGDLDTNTITGIKGDAEISYRIGNVSISKDHIGLSNVENTKDSTKNVATAKALATPASIDGVDFDGTVPISHYSVCNSEPFNIVKSVSCANFKLIKGAVITVTFNVINSANNPQLDVNNTGARNIQYRNNNIQADTLAAGHTYQFVFDGAYYQLIGDLDTNDDTQLLTGVKGSDESSYRTGFVNISPTNLGLGNVDNTSDKDKNVLSASKLTTPRTISISGAATGSTSFDGSTDVNLLLSSVNASKLVGTASINITGTAASANKADQDSSGNVISATYATLKDPAFTGTPTAPTVTDIYNSTDQLATTDFVQKVIQNLINVAPDTLEVLEDIAEVVNTDQDIKDVVVNAIAKKQEKNLALTSISNLATESNMILYTIAKDTYATANISPFVLTMLDDVSADDVRNTINALGTNDTTVARTDSPALIGVPTAPTASLGTNTVQIATTEFVQNAIQNLINVAPSTLNVLSTISTAINEDQNVLDAVSNAIANKQNLSSALTSISSLETTADSMIYTTAPDTYKVTALTPFARSILAGNNAEEVRSAIYALSKDETAANSNKLGGISAINYARLADPVFTGIPQAPTPNLGDSSNQIATTEFVQNSGVHYCLCETEADNRNKTAICTGFTLLKGNTIIVTFANTNTALNPTLNINNTGDISIQYQGKGISYTTIQAGKTYQFIYDGVYYQFIGDINTNTITGVKGSTESTYRTGNISISAADIGLGLVENKKDADREVKSAVKASQDSNGFVIASTYLKKTEKAADSAKADSATKAERDANNNVITDTYAPIVDSVLRGVPQAPTASSDTNTDQIATTKFVKTVINNVIGADSDLLNTIQQMQDMLDADGSIAAMLDSKQDKYAALDSIGKLTTAKDKMLYTTAADAYATTSLTLLARNLLSESTAADMRSRIDALGKTEKAVNSEEADHAANSDKLGGLDASKYAILDGPTFTISPQAPTPSSNSADKTVATTAFVKAQIDTLTSANNSILDQLAELGQQINGSSESGGEGITSALAGKQAKSEALTSLTDIAAEQDKLVYANGSARYATTDITAFARSILDDADAAEVRTTINALAANANAVSATKLANARDINITDADGVHTGTKISFDGTSSGIIKLPSTINANLVGLASKATNDSDNNPINSTYAKLASPTLTGTPKAPTAASGTNTDQIATTKFVQNAVIHYSECTTEGDTQVKVVDCDTFTLAPGNSIIIKFVNANTALNPQLNINNTGAKAVQYQGKNIVATYLQDKIYQFIFDGDNYQYVGDINTQLITGIKGSAETAYRTGNISISPANIGITVVNNTADANKNVLSAVKATNDSDDNPINTTYLKKTEKAADSAKADSATKATRDANNNVITDTYAPLNNPGFRGVPTAPTASNDTNTDQIATTKFVKTVINNVIGADSDLLNTIQQMQDMLDTDGSIATMLDSKQDKHAALTSISGLTTSVGQIIYTTGKDTYYPTTLTEFARNMLGESSAEAVRSHIDALGINEKAADSAKADIATKATNDSDNKPINTTYAKIDSPSFIGVPQAPTPGSSSADRTIATTEFVKGQIDALTAVNQDILSQLAELGQQINGGSGEEGEEGLASALAGKQNHYTALDSIGSLATVADQMLYTVNSNTYNTAALTEFARSILDDADAAAVRTTINALAANANAVSATKLANARDINITDADGSHSGTKISFNGTNTTELKIKLPSIIKATIEGAATKATNDSDGNQISTTYAKLGGATFTGNVTLASTPTANDNSLKAATTAYVDNAISALIGTAPETLDTLAEIANAINNDKDLYTTLTNAIGNKQDKHAALTSISGLTTAANKMIYTTAANTYATATLTEFARSILDDADAATVRSTIGALSTSGTAADSNKLGGTAASSYALLASPTFTGTPKAPTAASTSNDTQIATTAFVNTAISNGHYTTKLIAGGSTATANAVTTNGNTYLRLFDNTTARNSIKVTGTGATSVTSDANGVITINSTNTTYSDATASAHGLMSTTDKSKLDNITESADAVSFTANLTSGTKVGTITINGTGTDLYCQTNTDTHYTTKLIAGGSTATANAAVASGNVYLRLFDNDTHRNSIQLKPGSNVSITSDANGIITIASTDTNTDTKVTNELKTTTKAYITGTTSATTSTGTQIFDTGVYLSTTAGELVATKFTGNLTGNVTGNVSGTAANVTGTVAIANGGTGLNSSPSMLTDLGSTTAANILAASPRPGIMGTLAVANGGTGANALADIKAGKDAAGNTITTTYMPLQTATSGSLALANWVYESTESTSYKWKYNFTISGITAKDVVNASVTRACLNIAQVAGMCPLNESSANTVTFRSKEKPTAAIEIEYYVLKGKN